jgi:hypothetical protein
MKTAGQDYTESQQKDSSVTSHRLEETQIHLLHEGRKSDL